MVAGCSSCLLLGTATHRLLWLCVFTCCPSSKFSSCLFYELSTCRNWLTFRRGCEQFLSTQLSKMTEVWFGKLVLLSQEVHADGVLDARKLFCNLDAVYAVLLRIITSWNHRCCVYASSYKQIAVLQTDFLPDRAQLPQITSFWTPNEIGTCRIYDHPWRLLPFQGCRRTPQSFGPNAKSIIIIRFPLLMTSSGWCYAALLRLRSSDNCKRASMSGTQHFFIPVEGSLTSAAVIGAFSGTALVQSEYNQPAAI